MGQGYLQKCRKLKAGDVFRIEHLREIIEAVDASRPIGGVDVYTRETAGGVVLSAVGRKGSSSVDPTDREFQIKFLDMETMDLYPNRNPGDKKVPVIFGGRVYGKNAESMVWCGAEEGWEPMLSLELYVSVNVDTKGDVTGAAFVPMSGEDKPWKPGEIGIYFIKVGKIRNDGSVYQMLQGPIELPLSGDEKKEEDVHEFKIRLREVEVAPKASGGTSGEDKPEKITQVEMFWGRILMADYQTFDVGIKGQWQKVEKVTKDSGEVYLYFDVTHEGKVEKIEIKNEKRANKQFYPPDIEKTGGQKGEYCILVGTIKDEIITQSLHGPLPFESRVGKTKMEVTAYKGVIGQFLEFWPLIGTPGIDVSLKTVDNDETGKLEGVGVKFQNLLYAENGMIRFHYPSKNPSKPNHIGVEVLGALPFMVTIEGGEEENTEGASSSSESPSSSGENPPEESTKRVIVKANGGTVSYFKSSNDEYLTTWTGEDQEFPYKSDGYVYIEYYKPTDTFSIKYEYGIPTRWESNDSGQPSCSRCAIARIRGGEVTQLTHYSFILSPMFLGKNAFLDFSPYPSIPV